MGRSRSRSRSPRRDRSERMRRSRSRERDRRRSDHPERERLDRERIDRERIERDRSGRDRSDRDRLDRERVDRERHRERDRDRDRDRDRAPAARRRSRSPSAGRWQRGRSPSGRRRSLSPQSGSKGRGSMMMGRPEIDESQLEGKTEEDIEMMRIMGFCQFDTTKGEQTRYECKSATSSNIPSEAASCLGPEDKSGSVYQTHEREKSSVEHLHGSFTASDLLDHPDIEKGKPDPYFPCAGKLPLPSSPAPQSRLDSRHRRKSITPTSETFKNASFTRCRVCRVFGHSLGSSLCKHHTEGTDIIPFQGANDVLSNFYPCSVKLWNKTFHSTEQAYQYRKAVLWNLPDIAKQIMEQPTARDVKLLANRELKGLPEDSESVKLKVSIMKECLEAKAKCLPTYKNLLLHTPADIVFAEATSDLFWASGLSRIETQHTQKIVWPGRNVLGNMHKELSESLKTEEIEYMRSVGSGLNSSPNSKSRSNNSGLSHCDLEREPEVSKST